MTAPSPFERLRSAAGPLWTDFTGHRFVRGLGDGTLPIPAFRRYLTQDYLFLIQFARVYALAGFKAQCLADLRAASDGRWCTRQIQGEMAPNPKLLRDDRLATDGIRAPGRQHPVQHRHADGSLSLLGREAAGSQTRSDQRLVTTHRRFH